MKSYTFLLPDLNVGSLTDYGMSVEINGEQTPLNTIASEVQFQDSVSSDTYTLPVGQVSEVGVDQTESGKVLRLEITVDPQYLEDLITAATRTDDRSASTIQHGQRCCGLLDQSKCCRNR